MESPTALSKLQQLLAGLFQFDLSDLDFGIYRLFRLKRDELEKFIGEQIPRAAAEAFHGISAADHAVWRQRYEEISQTVREEWGDDAVTADGYLAEGIREQNTGKSARVLIAKFDSAAEKWRELSKFIVNEEDVFNHLYGFFSRYYDRGDFMPRRFFGARSHYAVPYNGEETHFHWANKDQHYIKTGEAFRDYSFTVADILGGPARVRFALTKANLPPGDTKGDRRYFFPQPGETAWDEKTRTLTIPFHYRLPVEAELKTAPVEENGESGEGEAEGGGKPKKISGDKLQDKLLADALDALLAACPDAGLADALRRVVNAEQVEAGGKPPVSHLAQRMRHFARRQTSDYFVHKNLAAFLREELDFYIRDQVVHVADLEGDFEGKRRMLRALRRLAGDLIEFLHHIEEVQRRLFEKRKFVLRTDYLCPVQNVPRGLWKDICASKAQLKEWQDIYALGKDGAGEGDLFAFKGKLTESFLENHPTLVVNTALFDEDFKWRLLESFDDLDAVTDGVLVKADNFQALQFFKRKLSQQLKCIYIDPPYNTGTDGFLYKDRFQHSSWLSMMEPRLVLARELLTSTGALFASIDDVEHTRLRGMLATIFGLENEIAQVVWEKRSGPPNDKIVGAVHEFILCYALDLSSSELSLLERTEENLARFQNPDADPKGPWVTGDLSANAKGGRFVESLFYEIVNPKTGAKHLPPEGACWRFNKERVERMIGEGAIFFGPEGNGRPKMKRYLSEVREGMTVPTIWKDLATNTHARDEIYSLFGTNTAFDTPKPTALIDRVIGIGNGSGGSVLDFFAGSGSTAHAVIQRNRADNKRRRFFLVEEQAYFDSVVVPRVQKVMFSPAWKDGKPTRLPNKDETARTPRLVKVLRLESYEDALHNLSADATLAASEEKAAAFKDALGAENYRLRYLARLPLEASASMLQTARLDHPFRYALEVLTDDGAEPRVVDLVETFNWLLGLDVQRVRRWEHAKREYRVVEGRDRAGRRVLVVWRDTEGLDPKAERAFLEMKVEELTRDAAPFDTMLANGDCAVPGFASLDGMFKQLMEAE